METYNDSDDDCLAIVMDWDENKDIQSDTEHAARQVDQEGDEEVGVELCPVRMRALIPARREFYPARERRKMKRKKSQITMS